MDKYFIATISLSISFLEIQSSDLHPFNKNATELPHKEIVSSDDPLFFPNYLPKHLLAKSLQLEESEQIAELPVLEEPIFEQPDETLSQRLEASAHIKVLKDLASSKI